METNYPLKVLCVDQGMYYFIKKGEYYYARASITSKNYVLKDFPDQAYPKHLFKVVADNTPKAVATCPTCKYFIVDRGMDPCLNCEDSAGTLRNFSAIDIAEPEAIGERHYDGDECWKAIKQVFTEEEVSGFCKINAFKYLWRHHRKDDPEKDVKKALDYLNAHVKGDF